MLIHWIWLAHRPGVSDRIKLQLLEHFRDPEDVFFGEEAAFSFVEGMTPEVILNALRRAGATFEDETGNVCGTITKQDLMELGLSGGKDSSARRLALLKKLDLPAHMSANAMLQALNLLYSLDDLTEIVKNFGELNHG